MLSLCRVLTMRAHCDMYIKGNKINVIFCHLLANLNKSLQSQSSHYVFIPNTHILLCILRRKTSSLSKAKGANYYKKEGNMYIVIKYRM